MNNPDLQQFARQLTAWTEAVIDHGRTPFRKVTLYTPLQTDQGQLAPPLIFWINRQSLMAGGLILLPEQDLAAELRRGRSCAEALGLRHFVTWETDRVRIWKLEDSEIIEHRQFPIGQTNHPDSFRLLLYDLLEALKLLAVLGMVPAAELSPHYLLNLFLATLDLSLPPLRQGFRRQRALDDDPSEDDAELLARELNQLTLLQLLALLWFQKLPTAILPEKLSRAIELSLTKLSPPLRQSLGRSLSGLELPHESAVCFHHLLLRLRQLNWQPPSERALTSIRLLIGSWYPEPVTPSPSVPVHFYPLNPDLQETTRSILSGSVSLLAAQSLLEELLQQPPRQQYFGNIFQFGVLPLPIEPIAACLVDDRRPTREERHQFTSLLRISWPNRRFRISGDKPFWFWETLHLLGLCAAKQKLQLNLPQEVLDLPPTDPFWTLLLENFCLLEVQQLAGQQLLITISRGTEPGRTFQLHTPEGVRKINPFPQLPALRAQLLLALALPVKVFNLIEQEFLWSAPQTNNTFPKAGLILYSQSHLCRLLWQQLSDTALPEDPEILMKNFASSGCPVPEVEILRELERQLQSPLQNDPSRQLDQVLVELLHCKEISDLRASVPIISKTVGPVGNSERDMKKDLHAQVSADGIPVFPDQYLYFLENPETVHFSLTPPLQIASEFLGQFELRDSEGKTLKVYGQEFSQALLLCAELDRNEIDLPIDREQLALILKSYRQDLRELQQKIRRLCHSRMESKAMARKMANKLWRELLLPAEKWFVD